MGIGGDGCLRSVGIAKREPLQGDAVDATLPRLRVVAGDLDTVELSRGVETDDVDVVNDVAGTPRHFVLFAGVLHGHEVHLRMRTRDSDHVAGLGDAQREGDRIGDRHGAATCVLRVHEIRRDFDHNAGVGDEGRGPGYVSGRRRRRCRDERGALGQDGAAEGQGYGQEEKCRVMTG